MKAIIYREYGSPDVLRYVDIDTPAPADGEVLIRIRAASVNPYDWHFMRGRPYFMRLMTGFGAPKVQRLGADAAGVVEAVGRSVTEFKPGDEVFGACRGSFAEFAIAPASRVVVKPERVTFEEAAAVPIAACTAIQGLRDAGGLKHGQKVLINGAAGGVGTFAVQIAKTFGANVTGICSSRSVDLVRSLGADRVIDYTREEPHADGQRYDLMLDCVGNHSLSACRRLLTPDGTYVVVGGRDGRWLGPLARVISARLLSRLVGQRLTSVMARVSAEDLTTLGDLMSAGKVTSVIDRRYHLDEVAAAIRYLEEGHAHGKVIIAF